MRKIQNDPIVWHQCNFSVHRGTGLYLPFRLNLGCFHSISSENGSELGRFWWWEDFEKFSPRFLYSKKSKNDLFHQFGPKFETIFSNFLNKTKAFLSGFLGLWMAFIRKLGFGMIINRWIFALFGQISMPIGAMCNVVIFCDELRG